MFEDKRFSNNDELNKGRFFMPEDNTGLKDGNQNLNFQQQTVYVPEPEPIARKPRKQINYKPIIISLIVILVLGVIVGTFFVIKEVMSSPIKVYNKAVDEGYTLLNDYLKERDRKALNYDINVDTLATSGTLKLESNIPVLSSLNGVDINYKSIIDVNNEQMDFNVKLGDLIDLASYLRDKKLFVREDNLFDKWIEVVDLSSLNIEDLKTEIDSNDVLNVAKVIKNYISSNLNKDHITKEKETIKVNGVDVKVTSNVYVVAKEDLKSHIKEIINAILSDANAVESLGDLLHKSKRDTESLLKEFSKNEEVYSQLKDLTIKIYTKGLASSFVGVSVFSGKMEVFNYGVVNDKKELNFNTYDLELNDLIVNDKHDITLYSKDVQIARISLDNKDDSTIIGFNINIDGVILKGTLNYEEKRVGDKRKTEIIGLDLSTSILGSDYNFKVDIDNMIQVGTKLDNVSIDASKKIEDLTQEDLKTIKSNLLKTLADTPLYAIYEVIESLIQQIDDNMCLNSFDCYCEEGTCYCSYLDSNNEVHDIVC